MSADGHNKVIYAVINNIPHDYHSSDLRNFFSQFIETKGFECFHFRHRPEVQKMKDDNIVESLSAHNSNKKTLCCVVKLQKRRYVDLVRMYNRKHWLDKKGESISSLCYISEINVATDQEGLDSPYKTRKEQKSVPEDREEFTESDLLKLPELHPPDVMPNGNVGTPTMVFLEFIRQCRLPPIVIKKLGLSFPKTRTNKKYGNVAFDYGMDVISVDDSNERDEVVVSGTGHEIVGEAAHKQEENNTNISRDSVQPAGSKNKSNTNIHNEPIITTKRKKKSKIDPEMRRRMKMNIEEKMIGTQSESEEDNDSCEEWERHEALYDDPSNQERNKERLFEEKIELKWEKGGSGLVFYTDAQFWQAQEGDFDEQTTDDWDVDMSIYYERGAGDKDAKDLVAMRQEQRRREGIEKTDRFSLGIARKHSADQEQAHVTSSKIGRFESHTKGIGRKIMESQGWKDGHGLGSTVQGISDALENEGKNPKDKKGFGYHGEKLIRPVKGKSRRVADREVIISTIYDNPQDNDPQEPLLRRNEPYHIKYRDKVEFQKGETYRPHNDNR